MIMIEDIFCRDTFYQYIVLFNYFALIKRTDFIFHYNFPLQFPLQHLSWNPAE